MTQVEFWKHSPYNDGVREMVPRSFPELRSRTAPASYQGAQECYLLPFGENSIVANVPQVDQPLLIVEDCPEDYEVTVRSFEKAGLTNPLVHCENGEEALDFLHHRGRYAGPEPAPQPILILLDLNLPGIDGREVLADIKQDEHLKLIPVVVLATSSDERDIKGCYRAGANSYIQKPVNLEGMMQSIIRLKEYWLESAILPRVEG